MAAVADKKLTMAGTDTEAISQPLLSGGTAAMPTTASNNMTAAGADVESGHNSDEDFAHEITALERMVSSATKSTADLAKHLPTGTLMVFQMLLPVFTSNGNCDTTNHALTAVLVALCALSCVFFSFTDGFKDPTGTVRYVIATPSGMWVIDGTMPPPSVDPASYHLKFIDFFHAFLSLMVFAAVACFTPNFMSCFYPVISRDTKLLLTAVPLAAGVVGSLLFVRFPSTRHGIGFPLTA